MPSDSSGDKDNKSNPLVSVSAKDLFGVGHGFDALMQGLRAGIGAAFDPWMRRWLARADQDAIHGWIDVTKDVGLEPSAIEVSTALGRSDVRLRAERQQRQKNRERVAGEAISETKTLLLEGVSPNGEATIEPEWLNRFWRLAEDISSEDLQSLWGRVIARHAMGTAKISARTLEALSLLSRAEMDLLTQVASVCFETVYGDDRQAGLLKVLHFPGPPALQDNEMLAVNRTIQSLLAPIDHEHLGSIGIALEGGWAYSFALKSRPGGGAPCSIGGSPFVVTGPSNFTPHVSFGSGVGLSLVGREIIALIRAAPNEAFVDALTEGLKVFGLRLERDPSAGK